MTSREMGREFPRNRSDFLIGGSDFLDGSLMHIEPFRVCSLPDVD